MAGKIPGFDILEPLGRGGMGEVYKAEQQGLGRPVALKLVRADKISPRHLARFQREARTMAQVRHPNLIQVFDTGVHEGVLWIALELIEGSSLDRRLRDVGPLPPSEAHAVVRQVAEALDALHQAGLQHRDVKPGNIMLESGGRAVLMDLGLAKDPDRTALTRTGAIVGTPVYMPAEVFLGEPLDVSCDVYALGITWWELLMGERPFLYEQLMDVARTRKAPPLPPVVLSEGTVPSRQLALLQSMTGPRAERPADGARLLERMEQGQRRTRGKRSGPYPREPDRRRWLPAALVGALVAGLGGAYLVSRSGADAPAPSPTEVREVPAEVAARKEELLRRLESFRWHPGELAWRHQVNHLDELKDSLADPAATSRLQRAGDALLAWIEVAAAQPGFPDPGDRELLGARGGARVAHILDDVISLARQLPSEQPGLVGVFVKEMRGLDGRWLAERRELLGRAQDETVSGARRLLQALGPGRESWRLLLKAGLTQGGRLKESVDLSREILVAMPETRDPVERRELRRALLHTLHAQTIIGQFWVREESLRRGLAGLRELARGLEGEARLQALLESLFMLSVRLRIDREPEANSALGAHLTELERTLPRPPGPGPELWLTRSLSVLQAVGGFGDFDGAAVAQERVEKLLGLGDG